MKFIITIFSYTLDYTFHKTRIVLMKKSPRIVLILCCLLPFLSHATTTTTPPNIQLATSYDKPENIENFWISEKLDGVRGYWNGSELLTRSGRHLNPPPWFTQGWPNEVLDGELWSKRDDFSFIVSCIKKQKVEPQNVETCWQRMSFMLFDLPSHSGTFTQRIGSMQAIVTSAQSPSLKMIVQYKVKNKADLFKALDKVTKNKGEGLMLHHQDALYQVGRTPHLLKLKQYQDDEAIVLKHFTGKGKHKNRLGAMLVKNTEGKTFKIGTGFTDKERESPPKVGSTITYRYTGKTAKGIPRFARFLRVRNE